MPNTLITDVKKIKNTKIKLQEINENIFYTLFLILPNSIEN